MGRWAPEQVVARAAAGGVEVLALTGHDTVEGVVEALDAGRRHSVVIVPAVEITVLDGERQDLHLLGHGIDHEDGIAAVHAAGGVAVWAHPFWDITDPGEVLDAINRFAHRGSAVSRPSTSRSPGSKRCRSPTRAPSGGLLSTGSADFHGPEHPRFNAIGAFDLHGREANLGMLVAGR